MIKIIKGYYGYKNGNSIIPKTANDAPFECDKAEEARLVKLGVAEYVTAGAESGEEAPEEKLYTSKTSLAELKEIAKANGATDEDLKPINSKVKAIELIEKLLAGAEDTGAESGEEAPDLGDDDGVVE